MAAERRTEIKQYIEAHLRNPDLTPTAISAALQLSRRYLRLLLQPKTTASRPTSGAGGLKSVRSSLRSRSGSGDRSPQRRRTGVSAASRILRARSRSYTGLLRVRSSKRAWSCRAGKTPAMRLGQTHLPRRDNERCDGRL